MDAKFTTLCFTLVTELCDKVFPRTSYLVCSVHEMTPTVLSMQTLVIQLAICLSGFAKCGIFFFVFFCQFLVFFLFRNFSLLY